MPPATDLRLDHEQRRSRELLIGALIILALTLIVYFPAMQGGFIWDDDQYVENNPLLQRGLEGLQRIWIPRQTPQYYPAVFTMFWIEHQLWGLAPQGYHIVNVLLHAVNAILVWRLATMLRIPWAWLIGAVFALHPVHVESVAWITERKNTLSACFYLIAANVYLKFDDDQASDEAKRGRWLLYAGSFACFVFALLSKTVACSLPAALILMMLWQRKAVTFARLAPLAPFFAIGLLLALNTAQIEREHVGAAGEDFDFSFAERLLIACRALLFYPLKIIWPWPVMFVYPRWSIDAGDALQWGAVGAVAMVGIAALVLYRRGVRGPFLALAFFAGTIFPALGFFNVYPFIFSFVADHFQYLASLGIIALIVGGAGAALRSRERMMVASAIVLLPLGAIAFVQARTYHSAETVYRDTIAKNPDAFMPRNNLATYLLRRMDEALEAGDMPRASGLAAEAEVQLRRAIELKPDYAQALANLSDLLRMAGRYDEALRYAQQSLDVIVSRREVREVIETGGRRESGPIAEAWWSIGRLQELLGHEDEALRSYREALSWNERDAIVHHELGRLLVKLQRIDEAAPHFYAAVLLDPGNAAAAGTLGNIRREQRRWSEARDLYVNALAASRDPAERLPVIVQLIRLLASCPDPQMRNVSEALRLAEGLVQQTRRQDPGALDLLATVLAERGDFAQAASVADEAAALAERMGLGDVAKDIRGRAEQYRAR